MRRKYLFTNALDMLKFVRIRYQRPIASKERYFTMSNVCFTVASSGRIRPHNWRLPFACGIAGIFSIVHQTAPSIAFMEQTKGKNESQIMEEDNAEDLECPFCRYFLNSHCREEFKVWQRCVKVRLLIVLLWFIKA